MQGFHLCLDGLNIATFLDFLKFAKSGFNRSLYIVANLVTGFGQCFLGCMDQAVSLILDFDLFLARLVFSRMFLGILDHLFDVGLAETAGSLDLDLLLAARTLVLCGHIDDAVGVDIEGHLNLRHAARSRGNFRQVEIAEQLVVGGHFTFPLENADGHGLLVVLCG